jgi:PKD repeat protein
MKNNQINKQHSFNVLPAPAVDLSYDPVNIYDKGLPSIHMKSNSIGSSFEWKIQGVQKPSFGKEVNAHFFTRGTYKVNLTVTSSNGCSASESMNVTMPDDYNLMAVNAINPNSHIEKNRAFMPHALKERNTPFTLLIIDPASGAIIFESNDVSNPWTGLDKRNGQAVEANRPYVWKVSLQHPLEGEKAEYKGTVILQ